MLERLSDERRGTPNDRLFSLMSAKKALGTACEKAKLPPFGHHAMRHFFGSNAIEAGCDFKVIAGGLGHKDGSVLVAMTYGHLRNEHSVAIAKKMTFDLAQPVCSLIDQFKSNRPAENSARLWTDPGQSGRVFSLHVER